MLLWLRSLLTLTPLRVLEQALCNLVDGDANSLWRALHLYDPLRRLGQHILASDHPGARDILDVLDLEALAANDGAHEVVRDEEAHRGEGARRGGSGRGGGSCIR